MASTTYQYRLTALVASILFLFSVASSTSHVSPHRMLSLVKQPPLVLNYHGGRLLKPTLTVNILWYGNFSAVQRAVLVDFLHSLSSTKLPSAPSVSTWWSTVASYKGGPCNVVVGSQVIDARYSLGRKTTLTAHHLKLLASRAAGKGKYEGQGSLNLVLTAADVAVEGFCMSTCGSHGWFNTADPAKMGRKVAKGPRAAYAWVGNSATQCPGECAWPFHKPIYGPQTPAMIPPSGDVGADGIVINVATVLAGAVTNPFDDGYFQGPNTAPLEAVSACTGIFGTGAFPGYPGEVLVDKKSKASFNAHGVNGREYLLPAMWDPRTSTCKTLV